MSRMHPTNGRAFQQGNQELGRDEPASDFNFQSMQTRQDIALIMTVQTNGMVTIYNHPNRTSEDKLRLRTDQPYPTGALYDTYVVTMAIYAEAGNASVIRLGAWSPGPPKKCYT